MSSPLPFRASEEPSKIRLSLPPTWFTMITGTPSRLAIAASISRRTARLECQNGDDERLMCTAGLCRINSSIGSTLYRGRCQKFLSFQASSQIVIARRTPSSSTTCWLRAAAK